MGPIKLRMYGTLEGTWTCGSTWGHFGDMWKTFVRSLLCVSRRSLGRVYGVDGGVGEGHKHISISIYVIAW